LTDVGYYIRSKQGKTLLTQTPEDIIPVVSKRLRENIYTSFTLLFVTEVATGKA
jgi:hypothetical protein